MNIRFNSDEGHCCWMGADKFTSLIQPRRSSWGSTPSVWVLAWKRFMCGRVWQKLVEGKEVLGQIKLTIFTDYYSNILRVIAVAPSHSSRGASTLSLVLLVGEIPVEKVLLEKWSTIETGLKRIWEMPLNVECRKSLCGIVDWYEDDDIESFWTTICSMFLNIAFEINMYKVRVKVYVKDTGRAEFVTRNL